MQKIKIWNIFDEEKIEKGEMFPLEVEAQVDNGAVRVILPRKIVEKLRLKPLGKTRVRYVRYAQRDCFASYLATPRNLRLREPPDMRRAERDTVHGLVIEILGRRTDCSAIIEPERTVPLIGQIVLEDLDLWVDSKNGKLIPNPESPDMPLLDEI